MDKKRSLLKISGTIGGAKHKEFEQTMRFVLNLLPPTCIASHLSQDVFRSDMYHVFTLWSTEDDLAKFKNSNEYQLIRGAYQALGFLDMALEGNLAEAQTFDVHHDH